MGRVQWTMAALSWLASVLGGCGADAYRIQPAKVPELVRRYQQRNEVVIWSGSKRYPVREAQEPKLRVTPAAPYEISAPLRDVRAEGDTLTFPTGQRLAASEFESAELLIDGEPLASLKGWEETTGGPSRLALTRSAFRSPGRPTSK